MSRTIHGITLAAVTVLLIAGPGRKFGAGSLTGLIRSTPTAMGSWIHAHLHVLEGDLGNAAYWYSKAGKGPRPPEQSDEEWVELVEENL